MRMAPEDWSCRTDEEENIAVIFGVTGLVGREIAKRLISKPGWKIYGVARNAGIIPIKSRSYHFISCDLLNPSETRQKLSSLQGITHVFWVTWSGQFPLDSQECCDQNKKMMANALEAILPMTNRLKHFSLQTGMKHYVSLQDPLIQRAIFYYNEECPRASSGRNFYYVLEDLLEEKLSGTVAWSVHRPGLLIGSSSRTLYNFMGSLCVYGTICKHLNLPFVFGGTRQCWEEFYIDGSDSRLVAEQHIYAATAAKMCAGEKCEAFNALNGPGFTWKEIWPTLGKKLGVKVAGNMFREDFWFQKEMAEKKRVWEEIVVKEGLVRTEIEDLANWAFLDALFRCPVKLLGTREKADRFGFKRRCRTLDSILYWIDVMRDERYIPF